MDNMQSAREPKKPCKGILKTSSSFDRPGASYRKSAKFDELNVLQTLHPADKDYGHMKIDEPKTPYNFMDPEADQNAALDPELLTEKLRLAASTQSPAFGDDDDDLSDDEFPETGEEKVRRLEFEKRRKAHYNEFEAVRMARKLIEEESDDDEECELTAGDEVTLRSKAESISDGTAASEHVAEEVASAECAVPKTKEANSELPKLEERTAYTHTMDVDHFDSSHPSYDRGVN